MSHSPSPYAADEISNGLEDGSIKGDDVWTAVEEVRHHRHHARIYTPPGPPTTPPPPPQVHEERSPGRGNPFKKLLASFYLTLGLGAPDLEATPGLLAATARAYLVLLRVPGARTHGVVHGLTYARALSVLGGLTAAAFAAPAASTSAAAVAKSAKAKAKAACPKTAPREGERKSSRRTAYSGSQAEQDDQMDVDAEEEEDVVALYALDAKSSAIEAARAGVRLLGELGNSASALPLANGQDTEPLVRTIDALVGCLSCIALAAAAHETVLALVLAHPSKNTVTVVLQVSAA